MPKAKYARRLRVLEIWDMCGLKEGKVIGEWRKFHKLMGSYEKFMPERKMPLG
jgi:hypothetical protein